MFKFITDNWNTIKNVLRDKRKSERLANLNIKYLESLVNVCTVFNSISIQLQTSSLPSICFVLPSIRLIRNVCEGRNEDSFISSYKRDVLNNSEKKWLDNLSMIHKAAFFLLPPSNQMQIDDLHNIKDFCVREIEKDFLYDESYSLSQNINSSFSSSIGNNNSNNINMSFFPQT